MRIEDRREDKIITDGNITSISHVGQMALIKLETGYIIWVNKTEMLILKEVKQ